MTCFWRPVTTGWRWLNNLVQAIDGNKFSSTQLDLDGLEETDEIKRFDEDYERSRAELEEELSPAFRDSMLVPKHPQASLPV